MAGKGQRRREKNYNAAHGGGNTRLPPPPEHSSLDAVPSKLRKLMSLTGPERKPFNRAKGNAVVDRGTNLGEATESISTGMKRKRSDQNLNVQHDEFTQISMNEKKKKKKKSNKADDLRFEAVVAPSTKRKEHKKQRADAKKNKVNKHKQSKSDEDTDFPGREEIKFGDIVKAPPKLTFAPKGVKTTNVASQERLRIQAVDAYRQRKGWASRPGVQLPSPVTSSPF